MSTNAVFIILAIVCYLAGMIYIGYRHSKGTSNSSDFYLGLSNPLDYSLPGPPSMGFSRQEYWSGVPLPSPTQPLEEINYNYMQPHGCVSRATHEFYVHRA